MEGSHLDSSFDRRVRCVHAKRNMETTRQARERDFHNEAFADGRRRGLTGVYAVLHDSRMFYERVLSSNCAGRDVLEYGCGPGGYSRFLAERGAHLTGIDISDVAVQQASEKARSEGFPATFRVMDAERLEFGDGSFDLVCSVAILHHLDLNRAYSEVARVLKRSGRAVFLEPLGHNPLINLFRRMTPHLRTPDEHPLLMKDLRLAEAYFNRVQSSFFAFHSLLAIPFRNTRSFLRILTRLEAVDRAFFRIAPTFRRYAWEVVVVLSEPRKAPSWDVADDGRTHPAGQPHG